MQLLMFRNKRLKHLVVLGALVLLLFVLSGCTMTMRDQPRFDTYSGNGFFEDSNVMLSPIDDTVARGQEREDEHLYTGMVDGEPAESYPFEITQEMLERGHERFDIFCSPCHSRLGDGTGIVVQRGFNKPPSFHDDRLREAAPGYFYGVITDGFGSMPSFANRVPSEDRWLIAAYIQALQFSQHADLASLPDADRSQLEKK